MKGKVNIMKKLIVTISILLTFMLIVPGINDDMSLDVYGATYKQKTAKNTKKLIKAINKNGTANSSGNKQITMNIVYEDGTTYNTATVLYNKKNKRVTYKFISQSKWYDSTVTMYVTKKGVAVISVTNKVSSGQSVNIKSKSGKVKIKALKYSTKKKYTFKKNLGKGATKADKDSANEMFNIQLRTAMSSWDSLLKNKAKVRLKNVGFKAFKPVQS